MLSKVRRWSASENVCLSVFLDGTQSNGNGGWCVEVRLKLLTLKKKRKGEICLFVAELWGTARML